MLKKYEKPFIKVVPLPDYCLLLHGSEGDSGTDSEASGYPGPLNSKKNDYEEDDFNDDVLFIWQIKKKHPVDSCKWGW